MMQVQVQVQVQVQKFCPTCSDGVWTAWEASSSSSPWRGEGELRRRIREADNEAVEKVDKGEKGEAEREMVEGEEKEGGLEEE